METVDETFPGPGAGGGGEGGNVRVSMFHCTLNTNRAYDSAETTQLAVNRLADWLDDDLFTESTMVGIIPVDGGPDRIIEVQVTNPAVEVGTRGRRVHAHWTLTVIHDSRLRLGLIQRLWQDYTRAHGPDCEGAYVRMDLLNTRAQNYAAKHRQT